MLLQKLYLANATETVDIRVTDGKFAAIAPQLEALPGEEVVDCCAGKMVLPPFVESHVHLDTCLTAAARTGIYPALCLKEFSAGKNISLSLPNRK